MKQLLLKRLNLRKKLLRNPKKVEEAPVVVEPVKELTVEAIKEEDDDDDDEESIETTIILQEGVEYLHCAKDNKVYDRNTFDEIGYFSTEVNQVFLF